MAVELDRYQDVLDELGEHAHEVLRASWDEAARVFSPRGLENQYLRGALSLKSLGRGTDLVVSYLQGAPLVAKDLGEEAVGEMYTKEVKGRIKGTGRINKRKKFNNRKKKQK
jgi:nitric oxide reductase NorD protein